MQRYYWPPQLPLIAGKKPDRGKILFLWSVLWQLASQLSRKFLSIHFLCVQCLKLKRVILDRETNEYMCSGKWKTWFNLMFMIMLIRCIEILQSCNSLMICCSRLLLPVDFIPGKKYLCSLLPLEVVFLIIEEEWISKMYRHLFD